jgi:hypothetical protein
VTSPIYCRWDVEQADRQRHNGDERRNRTVCTLELFMTASVLMTKSTTRTMNNEVFIAVSRRPSAFRFPPSEKSISLVGELVTARQLAVACAINWDEILTLNAK